MLDKLIDYNICEFKNGLKLVTIKKDSSIFSIHAGINIGAMYENREEKGISHYIEHMLFKGTASYNNEDLIEKFENCGGEYNAYTDYNCTVFNMSVLKEEGQNSVELISEILRNSIFDENEIEKERGVILSEIMSSRDDIEDFSYGKVNYYGFSKSPLKYDIIGEEKTVSSFKRQDLINFYLKYYVPNNCFISIVSSYEHGEIVELVKKYFEDWERKEFTRPHVIVEDNIPVRKITYKKDIEQATILYLYTFNDLTREEELALKILNHRLGESSNCLLFRKLREESGIAYDAYSEYDMTENIKTLYIYTAVSKGKVHEAEEVINKCIKDTKAEEIPLKDSFVELMKKVLKTSVINTVEDTSDLSNYALHQLIEKRSITQFEEDMNELKLITKADIFKVSRKVLKNPTVHILLPQG